MISAALICCTAAQQATQPRAQQPAGDDSTQQAERTAQATINWDKSSTPGTHVTVEMIRRGEVNGRVAMDFRVKVDGAPHDQRYNLVVWPITDANPTPMMDGLAIRQDGIVYCPADSTGSCAERIKGNELHLTYMPELGEIYRQAMISADQKSRIFFSFVPTPIVESEKNCSLEAVRLGPAFELAIIRGRGFAPGEELAFHTQSYQEIHNAQVKADAQGQFQASVTPFVKGHTTGTLEVSVKGRTCSPKISFNWGL